MGEWFGRNWISIIALFVSLGALYFSYLQSKIASKQSLQHIEPELTIYLNINNEQKLEYIISNTGVIPIVSVRVERCDYVFDKDTRKIVMKGSAGKSYYPYSNFIEKLKANDNEHIELSKTRDKFEFIDIYEIDIIYYRESDMQQFQKNGLFFVDGVNTYSHKEFKNRSIYKSIMKSIDEFSKIEFGTIKSTVKSD